MDNEHQAAGEQAAGGIALASEIAQCASSPSTGDGDPSELPPVDIDAALIAAFAQHWHIAGCKVTGADPVLVSIGEIRVLAVDMFYAGYGAALGDLGY